MSIKEYATAETDDEIEELKECIDALAKCDCVATLRQFIPTADGGMNKADVHQYVADKVRAMIYIDEGLMYLTIDKGKDNAQLKRLRSLWETMLKRGTELYKEGKPNDYALVIDLLKQDIENEVMYTMSFFKPIFASTEDGKLMFVFLLDRIFYGRESITQEELDYINEQARQELYDEGEFDKGGADNTYEAETEETEEEEEYDEMDDLLNNEDYLGVDFDE